MTVSTYIFEGVTLGALAQVGEACPTLNKRYIRAVSVTNPTGAAIPLTVQIVNPTYTRTHVSARTINPGETYNCQLELNNKGLSPGGYVSAGGVGLQFDYVATQISNG